MGKSTIYQTLYQVFKKRKNFNFEVIVESHAVVRENEERDYVSFIQFLSPNGNILQNYSII